MNHKFIYPLCLALGCLFLSPAASAQSKKAAEMQDVLYLKTGSVMRGNISNSEPNAPVSLRMADGSVLDFPQEEIERVAKEPAMNEDQIEREYLKSLRTAGFDSYTRVGYITGDHPGDKALWSFNSTFCLLQTSKFLSLGLGAGYDTYSHGDFIPVFGNLRAEVGGKNIRPYLFTDVGYTIGIVKGISDPAGGMLINPGAGVRMFTGVKTAVHLEASYRQQNAKEKSLLQDSPVQNVVYRQFMVTAGFSF